MPNAELDLNALGDALVSLRTQRGMSRRDLAESSGLSYPYVAELEKGRKNPSEKALAALAGALDVEPLGLQSIALGRASVDELARPVESGAPRMWSAMMESVARAPLPASGAVPPLFPSTPDDPGTSELTMRITEAVIAEIGPHIRDVVSGVLREAGLE